MKKLLCLVMATIMLTSLLLVGCGSTGETTKTADLQSSEAASEQTTLEQTTKEVTSDEKVTITFCHYGQEAQDTWVQLVQKFEAANPNIKVEADISGGDQYVPVLKAKFASNQSSDVVGVHPGISYAITFAKAGYLEDLSNESYVKSMDSGALRMGTLDGKVFALPIDTVYDVTYYNKDIFQKLNLSIPKTWKEFTDICEKLKQNKITPIAIGNKDAWVTQILPYALVPTMIYSKNINFDQDMYAGKVKFNGPEWKTVMERYIELNNKGYFNEGPLSTTYDQANALFAQGKAAMTVMGTWILKPVRDLNPSINLGMFILPASDDGNNWAAAAVGNMLAISSCSKHKAEAKKFLDFVMQMDNYEFYLTSSKNFPTVKGMKVKFDPAVEELIPQVTNTYNFLDQNWPAGVQDVFVKGYQEFFAGKPAEEVLADVDKEWVKRAGK